MFWVKVHPFECILFYSFNNVSDDQYSSFMASTLPKLKHSLSLTLQYFPPLAGDITWPPHEPKPIILYTPGDAVSLSIFESMAASNHISSNNVSEAPESHSLVPHLLISETKASVLALQITVFPNSGFCIGIKAHHAVLDGKPIILFLTSWAFICREKSPSLSTDLMPFYDRTVIKDPTGLDLYLKKWSEITGEPNSRNSIFQFVPMKVQPYLLRATFKLSYTDREKLRKKVAEKTKVELHLSSFVLTLAYVLVCNVKATYVDSSTKVYYGFATDFRHRLDPPISANYFGNCLGLCWDWDGTEKESA